MKLHQARTATGLGVDSLRPSQHSHQTKLWSVLRWRPTKKVALIGSGLLVSVSVATFIGNGMMFSQDHQVNFSYAETNCISRPTLLPSNDNYAAGQGFEASLGSIISLGSLKLYSGQTCIKPIAPLTGTNDVIKGSMAGIFNTTIDVNHSLPTPVLMQKEDAKISPIASLDFSLDQEDRFMSYQIQSNDSAAVCPKEGTVVSCPLKDLRLDYAAEHEIIISSSLNGQEAQVAQLIIMTADPLLLTESSIEQEQIIYDNPTSASFRFNRPLQNAGQAVLVATDQPSTDLEYLIEEDLVTVSLPDLARSLNYNISLDGFKGIDQSGQEQPATVTFFTAGSPQVTSTNLKDYGFETYTDIVVNFDYDLKPGQDLVTLTSNGESIEAVTNISGSKILINPSGNLPRCADIKMSVRSGAVNVHDVSSDSGAYSRTFRTRCANIGTIGRSVQGRSITSYSFGSGSKSILFYGALHGNEKSSKYILDSLITELEKSPSLIPEGVTVNIVPNANPDGFAIGQRYNANTVDLNRNFDTADWKSDVVIRGGATLEGGGGSSPMSEPETQAIANYTLSSGADLVVYYHAVANATIANGTSRSYNLADIYASLSGYPDQSYTDSSQLFSYDIVGTYGDWSSSRGVDGVLIELRSYTGNEYSANRSAILRMINEVQ